MALRIHDRGLKYHHGQTLTDMLVDYPVVLDDGPISDTLYPGNRR